MGSWSKSQIVLVVTLGVLVVGLGGYALYVNNQLQSNKTAQATTTPSPQITPSPAPAPTTSASAEPAATEMPAVQRCHTAGLSATVTTANAAAGTSYQTLKLTN